MRNYAARRKAIINKYAAFKRKLDDRYQKRLNGPGGLSEYGRTNLRQGYMNELRTLRESEDQELSTLAQMHKNSQQKGRGREA